MAGPPPADERDRDGDGAHDRATDHASIERLTDELLPALIAKLGATGLGELEGREGGWRVRLRRPAGDHSRTRDRKPADRKADRGAADRTDRGADRPSERPRTLHRPLEVTTARTESRAVATSPAVGIYRPRADLSAGA